jgi:phenylalanyl-tRNA synthetase alpha chain
MEPQEVAERLHENERKLLLELKNRGSASTDELAEVTGLSKDAVEKAAGWAETKGVITFREKVSHFYSLTEEGKRYAEHGLPEQTLRKELMFGPQEVSNLKSSFEGLNIALAWIRRNRWANIKNGVIELTEAGKEITDVPEEHILKILETPEPTDGEHFNQKEREVLDELIKRKLVIKAEKVERHLALTGFGQTIIPELESIKSRRIITQLTPEILSNKEYLDATFQRYDVHLPAPSPTPGKRHFISQVTTSNLTSGTSMHSTSPRTTQPAISPTPST